MQRLNRRRWELQVKLGPVGALWTNAAAGVSVVALSPAGDTRQLARLVAPPLRAPPGASLRSRRTGRDRRSQ